MNASFQELFEKYLIFKKPNLEPGSYESLKKLGVKIEKYETKRKRKLMLYDMNLDWFIHFSKGMTNGKYARCTNQTLKLYITHINGFLTQCENFGYAVNRDYIKFKQYLKRYKTPRFERPILLNEELAIVWKFKGYNMKNGKFVGLTNYKKKVRDLFLFQCQVGFRWGDISRLKRRDILSRNGKYYIVNFITQKRKAKVSVQLNELALKVIYTYCPKFETMPSNQPIFRNVADCSNATHILKWIAKKCCLDRQVIVKRGKLDKEVVKKKKIYELLSTHVARAKFATDWIMDGRDIYKLKIILGHSSIRTTERYIRTIPGWIPDGIDTDLNEEMLSLFEL